MNGFLKIFGIVVMLVCGLLEPVLTFWDFFEVLDTLKNQPWVGWDVVQGKKNPQSNHDNHTEGFKGFPGRTNEPKVHIINRKGYQSAENNMN